MSTRLRSAQRRALIACAVTAICLPLVARIAAGPPGGIVHIRWAEALDVPERHRLEAHFRLADGEYLDGQTWRYDLTDPSTENIRELVEAPEVRDTQHIDRSRFVFSDTEGTARRARFSFGSVLVMAADRASLVLSGIAVLLVLAQAAPGLLGRAEPRLLPCAALATLGLAVYGLALWLPPTEGDDLSYLSSVATIGNPLRYFIQDHGHGNGLYRPLTPLSMWVVYQAFDVWALPNQALNLGLHLVNAFLLYRIVQREQPDRTLALLVAAVFMVSQYTFTAATWVSDRPMLLVGFALLLLVDRLSIQGERSGTDTAGTVRVRAVVALTVLALMGKESGVVIPAVALAFAFAPGVVTRLPRRQRASVAVAAAASIALYVLFRLLIFGARFASYSQDGVMFLGLLEYEDSHDLSPLLLNVNYVENVLKNALAPILPVFGDKGAAVAWESFLTHWPVIFATTLLFVLAVRRQPSRVQWIAFMILLASAVTHYALFRLRLHYLSHAAFCLFVGTAPVTRSRGEEARERLSACKALAFVVLVGSILGATDALNDQRADSLRRLDLLRTSGGMSGGIAEKVLQRYR